MKKKILKKNVLKKKILKKNVLKKPVKKLNMKITKIDIIPEGLTNAQFKSLCFNLARAGYTVTPYTNLIEIKKNPECEW